MMQSWSSLMRCWKVSREKWKARMRKSIPRSRKTGSCKNRLRIWKLNYRSWKNRSCKNRQRQIPRWRIGMLKSKYWKKWSRVLKFSWSVRIMVSLIVIFSKGYWYIETLNQDQTTWKDKWDKGYSNALVIGATVKPHYLRVGKPSPASLHSRRLRKCHQRRWRH